MGQFALGQKGKEKGSLYIKHKLPRIETDV